MRARTRYFLVASLLVLIVGLGTGLVAYYVGVPDGLFSRQDTPQELSLIPHDAALVAHVDIRKVMASELRQAIKVRFPAESTGQREFAERTGIDLERDVDGLTASLVPSSDGSAHEPDGLLLVNGRFDTGKIEALLREKGAHVEEYKGARFVVSEFTGGPDGTRPAGAHPGDFAVAFLDQGLVAIGTRSLVRSAVDLRDGGQAVTSNGEVMELVGSFLGNDAWIVGRFDHLSKGAPLPQELLKNLPPITWFGAGAEVNSGVRGTLQVEAATTEAANSLRDVIRGFVALVRLQAPSQPVLKTVLDSLALGGADKRVSLSFSVPGQILDILGPNGLQMTPVQPESPRK